MVLVYGMAKEQKSMENRLQNASAPFALHLAKCFIYGKDCQAFNHWIKELNTFLQNIYKARDKEWKYINLRMIYRKFTSSSEISDYILAEGFRKYDVEKIILAFDDMLDILFDLILQKELPSKQKWEQLFSNLWKVKAEIDNRSKK